MKVTLFALNSSFTHTNLAVRYLASVLEDAGFFCCIKEFILKDKRSLVLHELVSTASDVYCFSAYIWNVKEMLNYACELKKLRPDCRIIFGGPEVSFENEEFFNKYPYVDTLILGEGENVITKVCRTPQIHKIIQGSCSNAFIEEGILYDRYPAKGDILYYESSRGCPHRCSYCLSSLTKGIRAKSVEKTLSDLRNFEDLPSKPRIIKFVDRTFNYDIIRAKEIWNALTGDEYTLNYHFEITADKLDEEAFEILASMPEGKIQLEAGIQSMNTSTLSAVNRNTDNLKAISNLTRLKETGNIHIHADLIAGLPYEDINSFADSFDKTIPCCHQLQLGFLKMLHGSAIRKEADKHGYIYESEPPYTVLQNNYISYDDIYKLTKIAATLDRFYSSDRFEHTMKYITEHCDSPFDFFSDLTDSLPKEIDKMSQHECRLVLIKLLEDDKEALSRLALDTLISENKNPPEQLKKYYKEHLWSIINAETEKFKCYGGNNSHIYTFSFDDEAYYIIDRTKHTVKRCIK